MTSKVSQPVGTRQKAQLMSAAEIERTLVRLVHEIIEKNDGARELALVGIRRRGVFLAQRIGKMIERIEKIPVPVGTLDITFYRDDLSPLAKPVVQKLRSAFRSQGRKLSLLTMFCTPAAQPAPPWMHCSGKADPVRCSSVC